VLPRRVGDNVKRMLGLPKTYLNHDWSILSSIGPVYSQHIIVDVGSHHGWFYHCWKDWCPDVEVHAFEPDGSACQTAQKLYGGRENNIYINQLGLGETEKTEQYYVFENSLVSSSVLKPDKKTWDSIAYETGPITSKSIRLTTLEKYCTENSLRSIYLLKIDVQGYEMAVLKGCNRMLEGTDHIFIESAIEPLYEKASRFTEVADFLLNSGFHLVSMRAWHRGNNRLIETDMLFRRNGLEGPIDKSIERTIEQLVPVK